jgi:hypothetical protein
MADRFFSAREIRNAHVTRPVSGEVFVWLSAIAIAGTLISCSFLVSARRHFEAVKLGYEREKLRDQATGLERNLERLELERDKVSSLEEIKKRATRAGLVPDPRKEVRRPGS